MQRDYSSLEESLDFKFPALIYVGTAALTSLPCAIGKGFCLPCSCCGLRLDITDLSHDEHVCSLECNGTEPTWACSGNSSSGRWPAKESSPDSKKNCPNCSPVSFAFSWPLMWHLLFCWKVSIQGSSSLNLSVWWLVLTEI